VGVSGSGKTALLLNLLLQFWLDYNNLQMFGESFILPEYKILKKP